MCDKCQKYASSEKDASNEKTAECGGFWGSVGMEIPSGFPQIFL